MFLFLTRKNCFLSFLPGWSEMIQTPQVLSEYHDSPRRVVHVLESSNFTFCGSPVNHKLFEIV